MKIILTSIFDEYDWIPFTRITKTDSKWNDWFEKWNYSLMLNDYRKYEDVVE